MERYRVPFYPDAGRRPRAGNRRATATAQARTGCGPPLPPVATVIGRMSFVHNPAIGSVDSSWRPHPGSPLTCAPGAPTVRVGRNSCVLRSDTPRSIRPTRQTDSMTRWCPFVGLAAAPFRRNTHKGSMTGIARRLNTRRRRNTHWPDGHARHDRQEDLPRLRETVVGGRVQRLGQDARRAGAPAGRAQMPAAASGSVPAFDACPRRPCPRSWRRRSATVTSPPCKSSYGAARRRAGTGSARRCGKVTSTSPKRSSNLVSSVTSSPWRPWGVLVQREWDKQGCSLS